MAMAAAMQLIATLQRQLQTERDANQLLTERLHEAIEAKNEAIETKNAADDAFESIKYNFRFIMYVMATKNADALTSMGVAPETVQEWATGCFTYDGLHTALQLMRHFPPGLFSDFVRLTE